MILSDIGISNKQITRMLLAEGGVYAVVVSIVSIGCTLLLAFCCKFLLTSETWCYQFTMEPAMNILLLIAVLSLLIPMAAYRIVMDHDNVNFL